MNCSSVRYMVGDCIEQMKTLPGQSVQCCVTSPPYYGLRDYGVSGQIGLEPTLAEYVSRLVEVFREVRRVLKDDGTLWLNLGDSYSSHGKWGGKTSGKHAYADGGNAIPRDKRTSGKPKSILGVPWRLAFALEVDGWLLRQDIVWAKTNPLPESVKDRFTRSHEYLFLLAKGPKYYFDHSSIQEPTSGKTGGSCVGKQSSASPGVQQRQYERPVYMTRNKRSVLTITPDRFKGAHFAVMPRELARICIVAGTRPGDTVLDPFGGVATTGIVSRTLGRSSILCELSPEYAALGEQRLAKLPSSM